jgi:hypothetical protein
MNHYYYGFIGYYLNVISYIIILNSVKKNNLKEINMNIIFLLGYSLLCYEKYCHIYKKNDILEDYSSGHALFFIYFMYKKLTNNLKVEFDDLALFGNLLLIKKETNYNLIGYVLLLIYYFYFIYNMFSTGEINETQGGLYLLGNILIIIYYLLYFI